MLSELSFGRTETNYEERSSGKVLIKQRFESVATKKEFQSHTETATLYNAVSLSLSLLIPSPEATHPTLVQASQQIGILAVMG
jgi:hypothetical protein